MRIEQLSYHDKLHDWRLNPTRFGDLNLLVGGSGAGKTRVLGAIQKVGGMAKGRGPETAEWSVRFQDQEGRACFWTGRSRSSNGGRGRPEATIEAERLEVLGETVAERDSGEVRFQDKSVPRLSPSESLVRLLSGENMVRPATEALRAIQLSDYAYAFPGYGSWRDWLMTTAEGVDSVAERFTDLATIRAGDLETELMLYLVWRNVSGVFEEIAEAFLEVFPSVAGLEYRPHRENGWPVLHLRETGVDGWVPAEDISSGMYKTLMLLTEMYLHPDGTVVLIDEFENSLGVNCLDVMARLVLQHAGRLQFIITSHHPYIINAIPMEYWKVVTRKGGVVTTHDAAELGLGRSKHQAFMQLINNPAYINGIS